MVALVAAAWFAVFAIPLLLVVPELPAADPRRRRGSASSAPTASSSTTCATLYRASPHTVYFLGASALFRDGLAAIFTFGAVLAVTVYGIAEGDVLIFGVAANVVSAAGALSARRLDDRIGPKAVIVVSLVGLLAAGGVLLFVSGPTMFWVFGLVLTLFVGPGAVVVAHLPGAAGPARAGRASCSGLYATTGRAVSFLAPTLFGLFTTVFGARPGRDRRDPASCSRRAWWRWSPVRRAG